MDGTISGALTAWAPPLTGTLADCQDLDTVGKWEKSIQILQDAVCQQMFYFLNLL